MPTRNSLKLGDKNIIIKPSDEPEKSLFLSLHIKLELTKQFVKALDFHRDCFQYTCYTFPELNGEKAGNFNGPQIRH